MEVITNALGPTVYELWESFGAAFAGLEVAFDAFEESPVSESFKGAVPVLLVITSPLPQCPCG